MKKRILFVLIFCLMLRTFSPINSLAAQHATLALSVSGSVKTGETVILSVMLTEAVDVDGIAVTPLYDESLFELTEGTWKINGIITDFSVENQDGVIAFAEGTSIDATILTFSLKVKDATEMGIYTVGCSVVISSTDKTRSTLTANAEVKVSCTHSYTDAWNTDMDNHWYECTVCGERKDQATHVFDENINVENAQICTVCKYEIAFDVTHRHDFTEHWYGDNETHWGKCSCEDESQPTPHVWDNGKILSEPGATESGVTLYTCTDCGRVKVEYTTSEQSPENTVALAKDETFVFGAGATVGALIGLIGGGVFFRLILFFNRKKKI